MTRAAVVVSMQLLALLLLAVAAGQHAAARKPREAGREKGKRELGLGRGPEFIAAARGHRGGGGALASLACLGVKWGGKKPRERCVRWWRRRKRPRGKSRAKENKAALESQVGCPAWIPIPVGSFALVWLGT